MATKHPRPSKSLFAMGIAEAAERGDLKCLEQMIHAGVDINVKTKKTKWTPLHKCAAKGHLQCLRTLLASGAEIEAQTLSGQTALLLASANGKDAVVRELIAFGADTGCINKIGWTPLHAALSCDATPAADALLSNGAEKSYRSMGGLMAHDVGSTTDSSRFWSPRVQARKEKDVEDLKAKPMMKQSSHDLVTGRDEADRSHRIIEQRALQREARRDKDRADRASRLRAYRVNDARSGCRKALNQSSVDTKHLVDGARTRLKYQIDAQEKSHAAAEANFDLKELFDMIDIDGSGELGKEEIATLACMLGTPLNAEELTDAMRAMDKDGSGEVDFGEFQRFWWEVKSNTESKWSKLVNERADNIIDSNDNHYVQEALTERDAKQAFQRIDVDMSGTIDIDEFKSLIGNMQSSDERTDRELERAFYAMDKDRGGSIDFDEFYRWWTRDKKGASFHAD